MIVYNFFSDNELKKLLPTLSSIPLLDEFEVYIFNELLVDGKAVHVDSNTLATPSKSPKTDSINYYKLVKLLVMVDEMYGLILARARKVEINHN